MKELEELKEVIKGVIQMLEEEHLRRVLQKLQRELQEENITKGTTYKMLVFGEGIDRIEGVAFSKDQFIKDLKDGKEVLQAGTMEVLGHTLITAGQGLLLMARRIKQEKKREAERN